MTRADINILYSVKGYLAVTIPQYQRNNAGDLILINCLQVRRIKRFMNFFIL
jgi:hypothetical protein